MNYTKILMDIVMVGSVGIIVGLFVYLTSLFYQGSHLVGWLPAGFYVDHNAIQNKVIQS
jgi:hypothetical protein